MRNAFRTLSATALMTALLSGLPPVAFAAQQRPAQQAQAAPAAAPPATPQQTFDDQNAQQTRERLREVLSQYPPSVGEVLRLDPSLLTRADYLAAYPALSAFLTQHPAIAHNPSFFLAFVRLTSSGGYMDAPESARMEGVRAIRDVFEGLFFLIGVCWGIGMIGWLIRSVIDYRAWQRAVKVQTDAHTKMIDRLTSNDDVLTYAQSPIGQRFLSGTALSGDFASRTVGSPVGRILWSVQIGIVLALGGIGLLIAKNSIVDEAAQALYVVAVIAIALGIGFALSAVAAYLLSRQLGVLQTQSTSTHA